MKLSKPLLSALLITLVLIVALAFLNYGQPSSSSSAKQRQPHLAQPLTDPLSSEHYANQSRERKTPYEASNIVILLAAGQDHIWGCTACHGDLGQGNKNIPRLAGLPAGYITKQLHDFAAKRRLNDNMQYVASDLSDQQMLAIGHYYSQQEVETSSSPSLGGDLIRGRELALQGEWSLDVPACFSCHGSAGWGVGQAFPAIAAQQPLYTYSQLANWKNGRRANSPMQLMKSIASALSDQDMRAVADYLASLAPPPKQAPLASAPNL